MSSTEPKTMVQPAPSLAVKLGQHQPGEHLVTAQAQVSIYSNLMMRIFSFLGGKVEEKASV